MATHPSPAPHRPELFGAAIDLTANLEDLSAVLHGLVESATELTGARYAALAVLDNRGQIATFVHHGVSPEVVERLAQPTGAGLLLEIPSHGHLLVEDIAAHPAFEGWPAHHPAMSNLLGVPLRIREQVYGRLYVADKDEGFTPVDARAMEQLAVAAAVAVDNARRYTLARDRERWLAASQRITAMLLAGTEEEEALELIAADVREVARADLALIVLPSVGDTWACEIADGTGADDVLGAVFPAGGRARTVLATGTGMIVDSMSRARAMRVPQLARYGPALYAPMLTQGVGSGVLLLLRLQGREEFEPEELTIAQAVAGQAALALELAAARQAHDVAALLDERQRISRDLHDLAIQQLFATGMQLETLRLTAAEDPATASFAPKIADALTSVDDSVHQIRSIVQSLRQPTEDVGLVARLHREASLARTGLGFAPSLVITLDGEAITAPADGATAAVDELDGRVDHDHADDVVAVVREGLANAARHARATSVRVTVGVTGLGDEGTVAIEVLDDGRGIAAGSDRRSGLENLAERARRHGGAFRHGPAPDGGTELTWHARLA